MLYPLTDLPIDWLRSYSVPNGRQQRTEVSHRIYNIPAAFKTKWRTRNAPIPFKLPYKLTTELFHCKRIQSYPSSSLTYPAACNAVASLRNRLKLVPREYFAEHETWHIAAVQHHLNITLVTTCQLTDRRYTLFFQQHATANSSFLAIRHMRAAFETK